MLLPERYRTTGPERRAQGMPDYGWRPPNNQISRCRQIYIRTYKNGNTVTPFGAWLGLERVMVNVTKFRWIDGTPLEGEYKNWFDGEPNNQGFNEDCVNMFGKSVDNRTSSRAEGKWNDYPCGCHNSLNLCPVVLCQRPLQP